MRKEIETVTDTRFIEGEGGLVAEADFICQIFVPRKCYAPKLAFRSSFFSLLFFSMTFFSSSFFFISSLVLAII